MCNCEVLPMTTVMPNSIGVYPDGKPVYYDPEKAAEAKIEKLKKLTEDVKTEASKPKDIVTVSYAPDYIKEHTKPLEFSPDRDTVELGNAGDKIIDIRKPDDDYDINNNEQKILSANIGASVGKVKVPPQIQDALVDVVVGLIKDYGAKAVLALFSAIATKVVGFGQKPEKVDADTEQKPTDYVVNTPQAEEPEMEEVA